MSLNTTKVAPTTGQQLQMLTMRATIGENKKYTPAERDGTEFKKWSYKMSYQLQTYTDTAEITSASLGSINNDQSVISCSFNGSAAIEVETPADFSFWLNNTSGAIPNGPAGGKFARLTNGYYCEGDDIHVFDWDDNTNQGNAITLLSSVTGCDNYIFTGIQQSVQTRSFSNKTYVRNYADVSIEDKIQDVTSISSSGFNGLIHRVGSLTGSINGGAAFTINSMTNSWFTLVQQSIAPLNVAGSRFIKDRRVYRSIGAWQLID